MFRTSVRLGLLLSFFLPTLGINAQTSGGPARGTFATTADTGLGVPASSASPRSFFLSGKVTIDDGTLLTDSVVVQSNCRGRIRTEGYTNSKGQFSFEINGLKESAAAANDQPIDSTQIGRRRDPLAAASAQTGLASDSLTSSWNECELQAVLPGFSSEPIDMSRHVPNFGFVDVGAIVLHRLSQVQGFTISATSALAPPKAQKEYQKGRAQEKKEKWDVALSNFQKAVAVYPKYAVAWFEIGRLQAHKGDVAGAKLSFHQSLSADPKFISPYQELAQLAAREKQWQDVVDTTDALLKLNAINFPEDWFLNGLANFYLQRFDAAEKSARSGLEIEGQRQVPKLEYLLGIILAQKHDYAGGLDHLRNYLRLAPHAADLEIAQKQAHELELLSAKTRAD
jgi:tetratricopeptide (TPR) repeat protein